MRTASFAPVTSMRRGGSCSSHQAATCPTHSLKVPSSRFFWTMTVIGASPIQPRAIEPDS